MFPCLRLWSSLSGPASMPQLMGPRVAISAIMACSPAEQGQGEGGKGVPKGRHGGVRGGVALLLPPSPSRR